MLIAKTVHAVTPPVRKAQTAMAPKISDARQDRDDDPEEADQNYEADDDLIPHAHCRFLRFPLLSRCWDSGAPTPPAHSGGSGRARRERFGSSAWVLLLEVFGPDDDSADGHLAAIQGVVGVLECPVHQLDDRQGRCHTGRQRRERPLPRLRRSRIAR
jgi:hypothetical protein